KSKLTPKTLHKHHNYQSVTIQANSAALKAQKLRCGIMRKNPKARL
ncbi:hypothetical protein BSPLISOX_1841, partial [uncultured Gammaproteobacteria bacterium]